MGEGYKIFCAGKDKLGSGSFATVYKGFYKDGVREKIEVAVKVIRDLTARNVLPEAEVMRALSHENLIRLYGFEERANFRRFPTLWIAMELCAGSLDAYMKGDLHLELRLEACVFSLSSVEITLMHQITKGVAHLHSNNYVHKDLKPDNILLHWQSPTKFTAKLADFGLVRKLEGGLVEPGDSYSGNAATMSPERASELNAYGTSSLDIYSLGIVFFMLLTKGANPFGSHQDVEQLKKNKESGTYCLKHDLVRRRQDAVCLIKRMISKIPSERPTAEQVLEHPTFMTRLDRYNFLRQFYDKEGLQLDKLQQTLKDRDPFELKTWTIEFQAENAEELEFDPSPYRECNNPLHALALAFRQANIDEDVRAEEDGRIFDEVYNFNKPSEELDESPLEVVRKKILSDGITVDYTLTQLFERSVPDFVSLLKLSMLEGDDFFFESLNSYGELQNAVEYNDEEEALKILDEMSVDVNGRNPDGNTALHLACERGSPAIVTILMERHAQWDIPNNVGLTPLHRAARRGDVGIVRTLLEKNRGKSLDARLVSGWTPLHEASSQGHAELVSYLLRETREWVKATDSKRRTPLHVAGNAEVAQYLLDNGPELLHQVDQKGRTPVFNACELNRVTLVAFLIDRGVNLTLKDSKGNTPLHVAVQSSAGDVVEMLLQHGTDTFAVENGNGEFPLFCAVSRDSMRVVEMLLDYGAPINQIDRAYETPLKKAIKRGKTDIAKLLIQKGVDLDAVDPLVGRNALHLAVKEENLEVAEALLVKGAKPNVQDSSDGCTALHYAVRCNSDETAEAFVKLLIRYEADANLQDCYGETVLHKIAYHRRLHLKEILIESGADETLKNNSGETAADITELEWGVHEDNSNSSESCDDD